MHQVHFPIYIYYRLCSWKFIGPRVLDVETLNLGHNMYFFVFLTCLMLASTMASSTTRLLGLNGGVMGLFDNPH
jgi:hypothetical protein